MIKGAYSSGPIATVVSLEEKLIAQVNLSHFILLQVPGIKTRRERWQESFIKDHESTTSTEVQSTEQQSSFFRTNLSR